MLGPYAVMPSPVDGSIWCTVAGFGGIRAATLRPKRQLIEIYNVPLPGFGVRGGDIDSNGVVWVSLSQRPSRELRPAQCKGPLTARRRPATNAPRAGRSTSIPGRASKALALTAPRSSYYTWVDQHNTLGLGDDVPISTGNLKTDSLRLGGKMVMLRVPYPMGFYAKGLDGRIDDPNAGWKGRGLWSASRRPRAMAQGGGKGSRPLVVHIQVRPDPLANSAFAAKRGRCASPECAPAFSRHRRQWA